MADLTRKTANLVDQNVFATTYTNYVTSANGIITFNSVTSTMSSEGVTVDIPANTVFTCIPLEVTNGILSFRIRFEGETEQDRQMVYLYDSNGEPNTIAPVTLSFAVKKITIFWSNASGGKTAAFKNFMVNAGSEPLPYEPYGWVHSLRKLTTAIDVVTNLPVTLYTDGQPVSSYTLKGNTSVSGTPSPQNPVTIQGVGNETANLLNYKEITTTPNYATVTLITNGVNLTGKYMATIDISLEVGSTYKMSWLQEVVSGTADTGWRYKYTDNTYSNYGGNGGGITVEKDVSQVLLYVTKSNDTASVNYTNIMLSKGSTSLPYEPYGYKISISSNGTALTPIYVSQPLYLYSTYADELSLSGAVTYNLDTLAFDGTENWQIYSSTTSFFYCTSSRVLVTKSGLINSHGYEINAISNGSETYQNIFRVYAINDYSTVEDFKQFLITQKAAGTPLTVLYIPATPTTETVTVPEITTTGGEVTLDVDTTVKPSELDLTYHGWHEHQPLKRENGQWV